MFKADGSISDTFLDEVAAEITPTGTITYSATLNMGSRWLLADGRDVSRTDYANLFTEIGTRYGTGDGTTTFTLPDIRGRSPMGAGQGTGLSHRDISTVSFGEEGHAQTEAELAAHRHAYNTSDGQLILVQQAPGHVNDITRGGSLDYAHADPMELTGSSAPFNVVHPVTILYAFIKT